MELDMLERSIGLSTDLYELTMAAAYFENGLNDRAVFELSIRHLPPPRTYLIAAGLEQALEYLSELRYTARDIDYLKDLPAFAKVSREFFEYLKEMRFTGDVWAMPEGTAAFAMEPLLRVEAPIIEAQIIETFLLSVLNFETLIATKAARMVTAARGRSIVDFGTRRAHGMEAGLLAARAAFIGGCAGTSNVEAGSALGIPVFGTVAHSFIMAFDDEAAAFRSFLDVFPENGTLLLDTYDTIAAAEMLTREFGPMVQSVRLDSGDLLTLGKEVRRILDQGGMRNTDIIASGDLNEYKIQGLINNGAPIDSFGVGTELTTSFDWPALGGIYKLVALYRNGVPMPKAKLSPDKATYPGAKQVWRFTDERGRYSGDLITFADEAPPRTNRSGTEGRPLLQPVMAGGVVIDPLPKLMDAGEMRKARLARLKKAQDRAASELSYLAPELLEIESQPEVDGHEPRTVPARHESSASSATKPGYPVRFSDRLERARQKLGSANC
jgi:nicotinate phosphoribosyltransferase